MVSPVVYHKYLNPHSVVDDGLQLLKIHLHASVPSHQDQVLSASVPALAVAALIPGSSPGAYGCRQVISHGGNGGIGYETLALFYDIGVSPHHTGGAIAHHRHLPLSQAAADSMDKRVHIGRFLIRMGKMLGQYNRIFLLPHGAGSAPCHIPEALSSSSAKTRSRTRSICSRRSFASAWTRMSLWTDGFFSSSSSISLTIT